LGCIKRDFFIKIGGIEEKFMAGMCYEDDEFSERVIRNNCEIFLSRRIAGIHLTHPREYQTKIYELMNNNFFIYKTEHNLVANNNLEWGDQKICWTIN
jgi:GT2 family glycosyltransferase